MSIRPFLILFFLLSSNIRMSAQTTLNADGPGNTYELITSVLAPGQNPIETPDCSHPGFGRHIEEVWDADLGKYVFLFHIHVSPDDDRCINFDRQRNEIKTYNQSPNNLKGVIGETVVYKWKFKLGAGFEPSSNFTHLHQIKAVGGTESSMPQITFTARSGNPQNLELRYAETNTQITLTEVPLNDFKGNWVDVEETITYGENGSYELSINKISDGSSLLYYQNNSIRMWKTGADFLRPKWGIYRSLLDAGSLNDEQVCFADFSVEEICQSSLSASAISASCISGTAGSNFASLQIDAFTNGDRYGYSIGNVYSGPDYASASPISGSVPITVSNTISNPTSLTLYTVRIYDGSDECFVDDVVVLFPGTGDDSDNDGVCDLDDVCPNFDDNLIGTNCDDMDPCTTIDVYDAACNCLGTFQDSDNDSICDNDDPCPNLNNTLIGTPCDDGLASTVNDTWNNNCNCQGQSVGSGGPCTVKIPLQAGWNLISTFCDPNNPDMEMVFTGIEANVIQVKDLTDSYSPAFEFNSIGDWEITSAYQVKVFQDDTLVVNGTKVDLLSTPIYLQAGWNFSAYFLEGDGSPFSVFGDLNPNLIQVKDLSGIYVPALNYSDIAPLKPNEGFQMKMSIADTLYYYPGDTL